MEKEKLPEDRPTEELVEPSPTSENPPGVVIPVDTPYGSNLPVAEQKPTAKETRREKPAAQTNSIRIPFWLFVLLAVGSLGLAFYLGAQGKTNTTIKENQAQQKENTPGNQTPKAGRKTNFITDGGLYKNSDSVDCWFMLDSRLQKAKSQVFIITGSPGNPQLIAALKKKRAEGELPVIILTGVDTPAHEIGKALDSGLPVYKITSTLDRPYTIVIIDNKLVMDISREHWIWESLEPDIIQKTKEWASNLIPGAAIQTK